MPTSKGNTPVSSFVKGLITEVSPLTFPENASLDEVNFKLKTDGTRERRLGVDLEADFAHYNIGMDANSLPSSTQSAFRWPSPNGSTKVDIGVIQVGRFIAFVNLLTDNPSANPLNGGIAIDTGVSNGAAWEFAILNNYLVAVSSASRTPYLLTYNEDSDTVTTETAPLLIRDLYGVDDTLDVERRPTVLTPAHTYNLRNQGWSPSIISTCGNDAIDCTFNTLGVYPSNSDQWGIGRIEDLTSADVNKYDPSIAERNIVDGGQVPRGHYIIEAFDRGTNRKAQTGINVILDRESTYPSTVAGYAGRAWYSGIRGEVLGGDERSPRMSNAVMYSQTFRSKVNLLRCHQEADPTSYEFNEVVDTDGGMLFITEAISIVKLMPIKNSLFVFALNGVWEIRGGQEGFSATSFQVTKVSSIGVYSPQSVVEVNGRILFWGVNGIYSITPNSELRDVWDTNNITETTIQRLYDSLPDLVKKGAKGYYDANSNTARWLYTSDSPKITGNPVDILPPSVPISALIEGEVLTLTNTAAANPITERVTDTTGIVLYRTSASDKLYAKMLTIDGDTNLSQGAEQTIVTGEGTLASHNLVYISDNKLLLVYAIGATTKARVLNVSGATVTPTAAVTLGTTSSAAYVAASLRLLKIAAGNYLLSYSNTDNNKPTLQVVLVGALDAITFGSVYKSPVSTTMTRVQPVMLSATAGVMSANTTTRNVLETFSVAGTVVTFSGVQNVFPTGTQLPATGYSMSVAGIVALDSTKVVVYGALTASPGVTNGMASFIGNVSGTAVTSTTILYQQTELGLVPQAINLDGSLVICYRKTVGALAIPSLVQNGLTTPTPVAIRSFGPTATDTNAGNPWIGAISSSLVLIAWEGGASGTVLKVQATRIT